MFLANVSSIGLRSDGYSIIALRNTPLTQAIDMDKKVEEVKENAMAIQSGLKSIGANRTVALSVHVTKEVIADMEERIAKLLEQLDNL